MTTVVLTIAGSDSSGGAGIQADLKTFAAFAVFGTSAITAITAQNTLGVSGVANLDPAFVAAQIDAVADDFTIAAAKTGMLSRTKVKGGSPAAVARAGDVQTQDAIDILYDGHNFREFRAPRVAIGHAHGAGCTLSAAIAASLARGESLENAIDAAKRYVTLALQNAPQIGHGSQPLNHSVAASLMYPKKR